MSPEKDAVRVVSLGSGNPRIKIIIIGAVVAGVIALYASIVTVPPGHRGVITHFGAVQKRVLGEGLHFIIPIVAKVSEMSIMIQKSEHQAKAASKDLQEVNAVIAVNWRLNEKGIEETYQKVGNIDRLVTTILQPAVTEVLKATTAKFTAEEVLTKRQEVKTNIDIMLQERLLPYRIDVTDVSIVDIGFSVEFNRAIESKQIAEQEAKRAIYDAQKATMLANAEINRAKGTSEAQKLLGRTLSKEVLQLQSIERWDGHFPKVMSGKANLPFIDMSAIRAGGR